VVLATFLVIGLVAEAFAPAPQGPPLSSFSTTPDGVAGWAALLQRAGHPVRQLRAPIAAASLDPGTTLVVLATAPLSTADMNRLTLFVTRGGRLVIGGPGARTYSEALLRDPGATPAALGPGTSSRTIGAGQAFVLVSPAPLENRDLATGDNAELSLRLAGSVVRPVTFAESIHGFGPATGLAAFPRRWWVAVALLALAAGAFVLARGRRLGGPDQIPPVAPSPRSAYLEAMAVTLRRTAERGRLGELAGDRELRQPESCRI
jgi:hypothetical protein